MKILDFVKDMKKKANIRLKELSGSEKCIEKTKNFQGGQADIFLIRGGAIEKTAITHLILKGIKMPGTGEEINAMIYQMEVFPENAYCPMGHFHTEWSMEGPGPYYMNLDLFPAVKIEEDLDTMRNLMDAVADKFGRDRDKMREELDIHYNLEHWTSPLATKVGCKLRKLKESELDLLITAYNTFFDAYLDIIRKRKDTPFSKEDERLKLERNARWLEYIVFKDRASKMAQALGVPLDVLIDLLYPPSVVF